MRSALRRRGWVEKFHNAPLPCELSPKMLKKASSQTKSEHSNPEVANYDLMDGEYIL